MAIHDAYARLTPYELSFPDLGFARSHFEAIRHEAEERGVDLRDPSAFVMLAASGQALREIRGPQDEPSLIRQYGFLLYHTFHFCAADEPLFLMPARVLRELLDRPAGGPPWTPTLEPPAGYAQLPQHLVWVQAAEDAPPESLDGFFWTRTSAGSFALLFILGMRGDRPGLSVVPLDELAAADAPEWIGMEMREGGGDFAPSMPGAELDRLFELRSAGEAIKLAALVLRALDRGGAAEPCAVATGADASSPRPSGLAWRRLRAG